MPNLKGSSLSFFKGENSIAGSISNVNPKLYYGVLYLWNHTAANKRTAKQTNKNRKEIGFRSSANSDARSDAGRQEPRYRLHLRRDQHWVLYLVPSLYSLLSRQRIYILNPSIPCVPSFLGGCSVVQCVVFISLCTFYLLAAAPACSSCGCTATRKRDTRKGERRRGCLLADTCATHRALRAPRNIFPCAIREKNHQGHARKRQSSRLYRSDDYRPSAQPTLK